MTTLTPTTSVTDVEITTTAGLLTKTTLVSNVESTEKSSISPSFTTTALSSTTTVTATAIGNLSDENWEPGPTQIS